MVPLGHPNSSQKTLFNVGETELDGTKDFIFCSNDINTECKYEEQNEKIQVVCIRDPAILAKNLEFKIVYKKESFYLVHNHFNYDFSNGVMMKLFPEEEFPIKAGSVFQIGALN